MLFSKQWYFLCPQKTFKLSMLKLRNFEIGTLIHCIVPQKLSLKTTNILNNNFKKFKNVVFVKWNKQKGKCRNILKNAMAIFSRMFFLFVIEISNKKESATKKLKPPNCGSVIVLLLFSLC